MDSECRLVEGLGSMKQPTLIKQLKSVLDQYPKGQILKHMKSAPITHTLATGLGLDTTIRYWNGLKQEMIQNAEDAGAREVKVLYEGRQCNRPEDLATLKYPSHLKALQGPGLCVYNDAQFTEKDWEGIQMIQCSNKEQDRLKVGRYGLGFKSVFHVTDWLCVVSGKWILFMNPHQPKDEVCLLRKISTMDRNTKDAILSLFKEKFDFSKYCIEEGSYKGTLFWFPLRQSKSDLSEDVYTESDIMNMFNDFTGEAKLTLLFLKSLEKISLFKISTLSTWRCIFFVEIGQQYLENIRKQRHQFTSQLPKGDELPSSLCHSKCHFSIECTEFVTDQHSKFTQDWIVVNFYKGGSMSDRLAHLCADTDLFYSPYVGVAYPLTDTDKIEGQIFCFMPLPPGAENTTGLPVHVNGFFALTQDRREVKWSGDDGKQDQWNHCLISEVIPEAYLILVKELKQHCKAKNNSPDVIDFFYGSLPDHSKVTDQWKPLLEPFYNEFFQIKTLFSEVSGGKWLHLKHVILAVSDSDVEPDVYKTVKKTYIGYQQNIVQLPDHIEERIKTKVSSVSPEGLCSLLKTSSLYMNFTPDERMDLLKYAFRSSSCTSLEGLALLPVADGTFQKFSENQVFFCPEKVHLFPGFERFLVRKKLDISIKQKLADMAKKGYHNLREVTSALFPRLVKASFSQNFPHGGPVVLQRSSTTLGEQWLRDLWSCAQELGLDMQSSFSELPLVPEFSEDTIRLHPLTDLFIAESFQGFETLPKEISQCVQNLGVVVLSHVPDYVHAMLPVGNIIQFPSLQGVMKILEHISEVNIEHFNKTSDESIKTEFVKYLASCKSVNPDAKKTLIHLELFGNTSSPSKNISVADLDKMAPTKQIPVAYPSAYLCGESALLHDFAIQLGAEEVSIFKIICEVLDIMACTNRNQYSDSDVQVFMKFILENSHVYLKSTEVKQKASLVEFLPSSGDGRFRKPSGLFDPRNPFLQKLFYGEDMFPSEEFCQSEIIEVLHKIGLKRDNDVSLEDVCNSASVIEVLSKNSEPERLIEKARSMLKVCKTFEAADIKYSRLLSFRWMPVLTVRPSIYPKNLPFTGTDKCIVGRLQDMCNLPHLPLVGSVRCVVMELLPNMIADFLESPPEDVVLEHLKNIINTYTADEHQKYMTQLDEVYKYFSRNQLSPKELIKLATMKVVWAGEDPKFIQADKVWINRSSSDVNITPYRHAIPDSLKCFSSFFQLIGASEKQTSKVLMAVLHEIQQKHECYMAKVCVSNDLLLVMKIVEVLKQDSSIDKKTILIPVHYSEERLVLKQVEDCIYCESYQPSNDEEEEEQQDEIEDTYFANISSDLARQLGVRILTHPLMDATEELDMNFGQKEPLTRRLRNLLKEYIDGFSVPKEIIQNADDAGANEVNFLYDERENLDARTYLINTGMAFLQGPALWAQNDAKFSNSDFANITKLSGETKLEDATKIGRFGLGFNTVYNLTDVPSFISGNHIVIFDPHESYLGSPGMKADLTKKKNKLMLRKMKDQFKPFEGVFGCHLVLNSDQTGYSGTLFRFPLRTSLQAQQSEISGLSYSPSEMKKFLQVFASSAGNLLLFCQNVKTVRMYHLPKNMSDASKATLLVEVQKKVEYISKPLSGSVLEFFSEVWKERCHNKNIGSNDFVNEKINISLFLSHAATELFNVTPTINEVKWTIAWVLGCGESAQMAMTKELKGLLPIAAAAVPVCEKQDCILLPLSDCPQGFYKEGHWFCFLPLPIKIPLPLHINGAFALTHDRKQLCSTSEDEKYVSTEAQWNEVLKSDAVSSSLIRVLEGLKIMGDVDAESFYKLWPQCEMQSEHLFRRFYEIVVKQNYNVLLYNGRWVSFQNALFLDQQLRLAKDVGEAAFKAAEYFNKTKMTVTYVPEKILECFAVAGLSSELEKNTLRMDKFYRDFFFPNISDSYWNNEDRNGLVMFALQHGNGDIKKLIKDTPCIPTRPSGILEQPPDLVHPSGRTACLFSDSDGVFPEFSTKSGNHKNGFCTPDLLAALAALGMQNEELKWSVVHERVRSIEALFEENVKEGNKRCENILKYLGENLIQRYDKNMDMKNRFMDCPNELKEKIQHERFLPILKKPLDWPTLWCSNSTEASLESPTLMCFEQCKYISGSNKLILDSSVLNLNLTRNVLVWLGVQSMSDIPVSNIIEHLLTTSLTPVETLNISAFKTLSKICSAVYEHLNNICSSTNTNGTELVSEMLHGKQVILQDKLFIRPEQMAFSLDYVLEPYLYKVSGIQLLSFLQTIGVRNTFEPTDAANVMMKIKESCGRKALSEGQLHCFQQAASLLVDLTNHKEPGYLGKEFISLYLPDKKRILHPFSELCLDDCEWLLEKDSMKFLHHCLSVEVAVAFGVKTKRHEDISSHAVLFNLQSFGQHEALTNRLKRILEGYPCDSSLMKELLQNADDAGASELMFIKDFGTHPSDRIFDDRWKSLQGPALVVYNNSYFTQKDLDGIQDLGLGSKGADPLKTGQYGVGFNVVYHLTDVPTFLTVGPETKETLCVLDPNCLYTPTAEPGIPGARFNNIPELRESYRDVFSCFLEDKFDLSTQGTLFRFPLRTKDMASQSRICKTEMSTSKLEELLNSFTDDMAESLLFLHNVRKITVASIMDNGDIKIEHAVEASTNVETNQKHQQFLSNSGEQVKNARDKNMGLKELEQNQSLVTLKIKDSNKPEEEEWLVVHQFGFSTNYVLPQELEEAWKRKDICMLPRGGVAARIDVQEAECDKKAFCVLPLPIKTGLPVHINGHFVLDHEARRNLWHGTCDYRTSWNICIVEALIVPAYLTALQHTQKLCVNVSRQKHIQMFIEKYNTLFPNIETVKDEFWQKVVFAFYKEALHNEFKLFAVVIEDKICIKWVAAYVNTGFPGFFNNLESYFKDIQDVKKLTSLLKRINMNVIDAPPWIYDNLIHAGIGDKVQCVTPTNTIAFLKSFNSERETDRCHLGEIPQQVKQTLFKQTNAVKFLITFCKKSEHFSSEINGLPLCLSNSGCLDVFSNENSILVTEFCVLIQGSPDKCLHKDIASLFVQFGNICPALKQMDIHDLSTLLCSTLDADVYRSGSTVRWKAENTQLPNKEWIRQFWIFLYYELGKQKSPSNFGELKEWSLLPCTVTLKNTNEASCTSHKELYPIKKCECVVNPYFRNEILVEAVQTLGLPFLDHIDSKVVEFASSIVANWQNPQSILIALSSHAYGKNSPTPEIGCMLLEYFCQEFCCRYIQGRIDVINMLKSLPFFATHFGTTQPLMNCKPFVFVDDHSKSIPLEGLDTWCSETGITIFQSEIGLMGLYLFLGITIHTAQDFYADFLLPHFKQLPRNSKYVHLKYIKDALIHPRSGKMSNNNQLVERLRTLSFIEKTDGTLCKASDFFSKKNKVFQVMCLPTQFLPMPYNEEEWHDFMVQAGMVSKMSEQLFIQFAQKVEKEGRHCITKNVRVMSDCLINYLLEPKYHLNIHLFPQIKTIRFVLPYNVKRHEKMGPEMTSIYPQFEKAKKLIAFGDSLSSEHCCLVWTSCSMYAEQNKHIFWQTPDVIGVPNKDVVISHLKNITRALENYKDKSEIKSVLQEVMRRCYEFIQKNLIHIMDIGHELKDYPILYLSDFDQMVRADEVIINLSDDQAVDGYIYKAPVFFGQFFELFENLGSAKNVTANHYAQVFEQMYLKTKGKKLHPNEMLIVKRAICKLFECLKDMDKNVQSISVPCLYLPNEERQKDTFTYELKDATKLVMADNHVLKGRVHLLKLDYLIGFNSLQLDRLNPRGDILSLPEIYRPQILSKLVREQVTEECIQKAFRGNVSISFQEYVAFPEFINGVICLVNDMRDETLFTSPEEAKVIEQTLLGLEFFEVLELKTHLVYLDKTVKESTKPRKCFFEKQHSGQNASHCIYLDKTSCDKYDCACMEISKTINKILHGQIGKGVVTLSIMFKTDRNAISSYLDSEAIVSSNYGCTQTGRAIPLAGSLIPEVLHYMLKNNFDILRIGEYVALEVYDPQIDETSNKSQNEAVYIYAVVKSITEQNDNPMMIKYQVDVGERLEVVVGVKLYKFIRETHNVGLELVPLSSSATSSNEATVDLETVLKEIRKSLKDAWSGLDEHDRKRVIKRLYLKWHPDKNDPSMKDLCTEVCQYIQKYVAKLNKGESLDDTSEEYHPPSKRRKHNERRNDFSSFFDFMDQRSSKQKEHKQSTSSSSHANYFHSDTSQNDYPHPQEARRWLRQAKKDIDAASKDLSNPPHDACNWICFKSHQAAEKALKAMCYNQNANKTDRIRSHNLCSIAHNLRDATTNLLEIVNKLETLVIDFNRMRYPDRLSFPQIPSDVYTQDTAREAFQLANQIVCHAEKHIS